MSAPYVCLSCRTKLLLPRIRSARLISYSAQHRDGIESVLNADKSQAQQPTRGRYSGKELKPEQLLDILDKPWESSSTGEPHPVRRANPAYRSDDRDRPHRERPQQRSQPSKPASKQDDPALEELFALFRDRLHKKDLARAWQAVQTISDYCSRNPTTSIGRWLNDGQVRQGLKQFSYAVNLRWLKSLQEVDSPDRPPCTPSELLSALRPLKIQKTWWYRPLLWQTATGVLQADLAPAPLAAAIEELVEMWRLTMAARLAPGFQDTSGGQSPRFSVHDRTDWSFLPSKTIFASMPHENRSHRTFENMLSMLVVADSGKGRLDPRGNDFASPALLTLDLLRQNDPHASLAQSPQIAPFVEILEAMLKTAPSPRVPLQLQETMTTLADMKLRERYKAVCQRLDLEEPQSPPVTSASTQSEGTRNQESDGLQSGIEEADAQSPAVTPKMHANEATDPVQRFALKNKTRLGKAIEQRNITMVQKIHHETFAFAASHGHTLPLELYEHLMQAYMQLRRTKEAVEIWHHILQAGYQPTTKTYTVMMRGAQSTRDVSGSEAFWNNMRTRMQPDVHAWTVRIHGLLKQKRAVPQGLQALREMGTDWLSAAKRRSPTSSPQELLQKFPGAVDGVPRPSLPVVNAAIAGLASTDNSQIAKVLSWGRSFGIEPDLITYNALLNLAMRHGQADEALKILQHMHSRGIEADSVTWTVLLTALFERGFLDDLDHVQQQTKIIGFIDALNNKELGLSGIDNKGYALIIDRLLKNYSNATAATAVLSHMIRGGKEPTTQIYTILMTSYFQRQPQPDLSAIEVLWKQIQSQNNGWGAPLDQVFYDRMIEGYATFHRATGIQPALEFMKRQRQAGQMPGWAALTAVARALAERGEMTRLKALMDDVRKDLRGTRGATQHRGQSQFWELIIETGLLESEGITRPEQLLPAEVRKSPMLSAQAG